MNIAAEGDGSQLAKIWFGQCYSEDVWSENIDRQRAVLLTQLLYLATLQPFFPYKTNKATFSASFCDFFSLGFETMLCSYLRGLCPDVWDPGLLTCVTDSHTGSFRSSFSCSILNIFIDSWTNFDCVTIKTDSSYTPAQKSRSV